MEYLCQSTEKLRIEIIRGCLGFEGVLFGKFMWICRIRSKCGSCRGFWSGWSGKRTASMSFFVIGFHFLKNSMSMVPSRLSRDLMIPCSLSKGSPRFNGFLVGGVVYCICILLGQNAFINALRLGMSGGGIVDQGCPLLFAINEARLCLIFKARGRR